MPDQIRSGNISLTGLLQLLSITGVSAEGVKFSGTCYQIRSHSILDQIKPD